MTEAAADPDVGRDAVRTFLGRVRRRWLAITAVGAVTRTAMALASALGLVTAVDWIRPLGGAGLLVAAALVALATALVSGLAVWPLRRRPSDRQVARFVEEACPELEDRLVSATEHVDPGDAPHPFGELVMADAGLRVGAIDPRRIVSNRIVRERLSRAAIAGVALAVVAVLARGPASRTLDAFRLYVWPSSVAIEITPGDARVAIGQPLLIRARVTSASTDSIGGTIPMIIVDDGVEERTVGMAPDGDGFGFEVGAVAGDFRYRVSAGSVESPTYRVVALHPPVVARIDVEYDYPAFTGLDDRLEEDGGDIYAPAGTNVRLKVHVTGDVVDGAMAMSGGERVRLADVDGAFGARLRIDGDGSYRIALVDRDGLSNDRGMEYFIRVMDDRPPDVHIVRPAGDRQITSLEEVVIEARADDDYGIATFDLVYSVRGTVERVVPLGRPGGPSAVSGSHTIHVEELDVQPGDFITYYARARDVSRAKRATEARSDIFFLDVKPFEEEFVAAQSQAMSGAGATNSFQDLVAAQKAIIVATWKLERRSRGGTSAEDIGAVARAQAEVKLKTEEAAAAMARPRARRSPGSAEQGDEAVTSPLADAAVAMGVAAEALDRLETAAAIEPEMQALNHLLKAEAEVRRRQVARQQAQGGAGGGTGAQEDLSALFDRELQREQETNYETPRSTASRGNDESEALNRVRDLARRQDELAAQQRALAKQQGAMPEEELRRRLERLTREQSELRQQAEELARQMAAQDGGQSSAGASQSGNPTAGGESSQGSAARRDRMREASEQMRQAASELRRADPDQASDRADTALAELRDLERELAGALPDEQRRALGTLQLESRQVADAQRRLAQETRRADAGVPSEDSLRRIAAEKEDLADRVDDLARHMESVARNAGQATRDVLDEARRAMSRDDVSGQMRDSAAALRRLEPGEEGGAQAAPGGNPTQARAGTPDSEMADLVRQDDRLAQTLEDVARSVEQAGLDGPDPTRALSEQMRSLSEARDRLRALQADLERLAGSPEEGQSAGGDPTTGERARGSSAEPGDDRRTQLEEAYRQELNDALQLLDQLTGEGTGGGGRSTPEGQRASLSAPGTEAFKQDFAAWDELRREVTLSLERLEASLAGRLQTEAADDRLNAGGDQQTPEAYRALVSKYYEALAARKPN